MHGLKSLDTASYKFREFHFWTIDPDHTTRLYFQKVDKPIPVLNEQFLIEAVAYEDGWMHIMTIDSHFCNEIEYRLERHLPPTGISYCFICNTEPQYVKMIDQTLEYYNNLGIGIPVETVIYQEPSETFDMAKARNKSIDMAKYDHIFMLDLDVRLSKENCGHILNMWNTIYHNGVFNLKNDYRQGNGLWFGSKEVFKRNKYNEKFKKFWHEDTEFMMNFSRIGILPTVIFTDFIQIPHDRVYTKQHTNTNDVLFKEIFHHGRT